MIKYKSFEVEFVDFETYSITADVVVRYMVVEGSERADNPNDYYGYADVVGVEINGWDKINDDGDIFERGTYGGQLEVGEREAIIKEVMSIHLDHDFDDDDPY